MASSNTREDLITTTNLELGDQYWRLNADYRSKEKYQSPHPYTIPLMGKRRTKQMCEFQSPSETFRSQAKGHYAHSGSPSKGVLNLPILQVRSGPQSTTRGTDSKNARISNTCMLQFSDCKINTGLFEEHSDLLAYAYILQ